MIEGGTRIDWERAKARRIDAELRSLGKGDGRLRFALGEALEAMARSRGHYALGFSSIEAYARERCGLGPGTVRQLRRVARRTADLPRLRRALTDGRIGFSKAELLARHATPHSEAFLVALARRSSIAELREVFRDPAAKRGNRLSFAYRRSPRRLFRRALATRRIPGVEPPLAYLPQANRAARAVAEASGGEPQNVINETLLDMSTTAHILGGCPIGPDPQHGVIDTDHQVFGHPGLYVVDGSAIPANVGVNPSLTITAMAERAMGRIPPAEPPSGRA